MSDTFLRIIPCDPSYVPPPAARKAAVDRVRKLVPRAREVTAELNLEIVFVDQGENFEEVRCPSCRQPLPQAWWSEKVQAADTVEDLAVVVPCCGASTSLNDLEYDWPAGFARFVIEAREPEIDGWLDAAALRKIAAALGAPVRQILARY